MAVFEKGDAFGRERIHALLMRTPIHRSTSYLIVALFLLPLFAEVIAIQLIRDMPRPDGANHWLIGLLEVSAGYLPVIDRFLLAGYDLIPHAFAHLVGFWAAITAFILMVLVAPSVPLLVASIDSASRQADRRGKEFKFYWVVVLAVLVSAVAFYSQFFAMAGTKNVILFYEKTPRPDLMKFEGALRYLLDKPLLYAIFSGAMWGGSAVIWRYAILIIGNLHHFEEIHSVSMIFHHKKDKSE